MFDHFVNLALKRLTYFDSAMSAKLESEKMENSIPIYFMYYDYIDVLSTSKGRPAEDVSLERF